MSVFKYFIGIDISKASLQIAVRAAQGIEKEYTIANTQESVEKFLEDLGKDLADFDLADSLFCAEHTGLYVLPLTQVLSSLPAKLWLENATQIKRSLGLQRGKNDRVDAQRIAEYAQRFEDKVQLFEAPPFEHQQLVALLEVRDRLVKAHQQIATPLKEAKAFQHPRIYKAMKKACQKSLEALSEEIDLIDKQIKELIDNNGPLKKLFERITSVPGIGPILALNLILITNSFTAFQNAKQLACFAGIAPFEHQSGSSIRGKSRVSHFANKKLKKLLTLGAFAAIQGKNELAQYYKRKTAEGKPKMSVINAVRNKIIQRVFAVVKNQTTYQKNYQFSLVLP